MSMRLSPIAAVVLALAMSSGVAQAQSKTANRGSAVVPVLNKDSGKLEAVLLLEPATTGIGARTRFGSSILEATYGLQAGSSLALLCDRKSGISATIGQLADNCVMATLDNNSAGGASRRSIIGASLSRNGSKLGLAAGSARDFLPSWLAPNLGGAKVESSDFSLFAEKSIGREAVISVGGTVARARLVPAADVPRLADEWNTRSVSVAGGIGSFGANIVGRVVNVPGESDVWKGMGMGLTWRTPWSGQLSVGADNLVTEGKNPFTAAGSKDNEGTVPYVRYQQDL